jgi:hypothetical protein
MKRKVRCGHTVAQFSSHPSIHPSTHLYLRVVEEEDGVKARRLSLEHHSRDARGRPDAARQHVDVAMDVVDGGDPEVAVHIGVSVGWAL